ncbi:MAG: DUF2442 domain-containing protein [Bacteroidota bacterium]
MNSSKVGKSTSKVEVTNISPHGVWIFIEDKEYFIPFEKFPWFKEGKVHEIMEVEYLHSYHLYWPKLDIDLTIDRLENPDQYPLVYRTG